MANPGPRNSESIGEKTIQALTLAILAYFDGR